MTERRARVAVAAVVLAGVALRLLYLGGPGFPTDVDTFRAWAERLADLGPGGFYEPGYFSDYPPAFLYLLWALGALLDGEALRLAIKAVTIPFDVAIALVAAALLWRRSMAAAVVATVLWLLAPGTIFAGTYWGQVDAVGTLPALLALIAAGERRWALAGALAALAALVKPQFGLAAVVVAVAAAIEFVRFADWRPVARLLASAGAVTLALGLPFRSGPAELVGLVRTASETYPYTSLYAFNGWSVFAGFWQPDERFVVAGAVLLVVGVAAACLPLWWRRDVAMLLACGALAVFAFYFLPTRAHERYLFPAFAFLLPFAATRVRVLVPYALLGLGFFASMVVVFTRYSLVDVPGPLDATLLSRPGEIALALAMIGAAVAIAWLLVSGEASLVSTLGLTLPARSGAAWRLPDGLRPGHAPTRRDVLVALAVAILVLGTRGFRLDHPRDMYFDEVYHARTAFELLAQRPVYEWTHPMLAKELIALGILGFGGDRVVGREHWSQNAEAVAVDGQGRRAIVAQGTIALIGSDGRSRTLAKVDRTVGLAWSGERVVFTHGRSLVAAPLEELPSNARLPEQPLAYDAPVTSLAVAGSRIAVGTSAGVSIHDADLSVAPVAVPVEVVALTARADGAALYVLDPTGTVLVVDPSSGTVTKRLEGDAPSVAIAHATSPDRLFLALADEPALEVIELEGGRRERVPLANARTGTFASGATALAVVPRAQFLYALADGRLVVVETHGASPYAAIPVSGTMLGLDGEADRLLVAGPGGVELVETGRHALAWRLPGVVFGAVLAFFLVLLARRLFAAPGAPLIAGALVLLDGSMFAQARIAMNDIYAAAFIVAGWYFVVAAHAPRRSAALDLLLAGVAFGLAAAAKWVAFYAIAGVLLLSLVQTARGYERRDRSPLPAQGPQVLGSGGPLDLLAPRGPLRRRGANALFLFACFALVPLAIYLAAYLPWFGGRMTPYDWDLVELTKQMFWYHSNLLSNHEAGSPWWSWPIVLKPVYWYYAASDGDSAVIYDAGNVAIYWAALVATVWCAVAAFRARSLSLGFVVFALLVQLLAWVPITRVVFFYHFFTALPFYLLALAAGLVALWERGRRGGVAAFFALAAGVFAFFYPFVSGQPVAADQSGIFFILPTWQHGCQFYPRFIDGVEIHGLHFICDIAFAPNLDASAVAARLGGAALVALVAAAGLAALYWREPLRAWLTARVSVGRSRSG